MNTQKTLHPFEVPANEAERLVSVRSLLPSQITTTPELDILTGLVKDVFHAASSAVTIIDEDWQRIAATSGIKAGSCPREQSACTYVVQSGQQFVVEDMTLHPAFRNKAYVKGFPSFRFYAGFPLEIDEGLTLGALCIIDTKPRIFNAEQSEKLRKFALLASALLRLQRNNIYLQNDKVALRHNALTDPLTELFNRRALSELVSPMLQQLFSSQQSAGIILADMDQFKSINDSLGHPAGDKLLMLASQRIRSVIRPDDIPVRVGGDEFCIIMPELKNDAQLDAIAGRLIEAFRAPFLIDGKEIYSSLSIGSLMAPRDGRTDEELSLHTDKALYTAKANGRNHYVRFDYSML